MTRCDPDEYHRPFDRARGRRSICLKGYDYTQAGAYFVTIVTREREPWFGQVVSGEIVLNENGRIVESEWHGLPERFPAIRLDEFVVMPNHVHFIVWLNPPVVGARFNRAPTDNAPTTTIGQTFTVDPDRPALGQIVRAFKAVIARRIRKVGADDFAWQRNYYERIIRNERELNAICQYIRDNPARWFEDTENPECVVMAR